ncbi:MAG: hypothetical protein DRO67_00130 [Candidatus Asgardarchaeum californiense]|nr:MAG: hypothetical protein DRO67_00130 [Candidatus Asgardarchaeum californiense]
MKEGEEKYAIGRYVSGRKTTIEYLVDPLGETVLFNSKDHAVKFLTDNGDSYEEATDPGLYIFQKVKKLGKMLVIVEE